MLQPKIAPSPLPSMDDLIRDAVLLIRAMKSDGTRFLSEAEAAQIIKRICEISRLEGERIGFSSILEGVGIYPSTKET